MSESEQKERLIYLSAPPPQPVRDDREVRGPWRPGGAERAQPRVPPEVKYLYQDVPAK